MQKYFYLIILYQNIINILILSQLNKRVGLSNFLNRTSGHRNGVASGIVIGRRYLAEEVSKIQKCGQFLRGFKTL